MLVIISNSDVVIWYSVYNDVVDVANHSLHGASV